MKKLSLLFCFLIIVSACGIKPDNAVSVKNYQTVNDFLQQKDFFRARDFYQANKNAIAKPYSLILEAHIANAFNKPKESNLSIHKVFKEYASIIPDSVKQELLELEQGNHARLFEYKKADETITKTLEAYSGLLTQDEIHDYNNTQKIWAALAGQPKQEVTINHRTAIKMSRDIAQLTNLPVTVDGKTIDFIFDTGANISVVMQTTAKAFGMKMLDASIEVGAITGLKVNSGLALCPEFSIEGITVKNAVFLVFPDEALAFSQINYQINGILGFPVIEALKQIEITKADEFIVPQQPGNDNLRNMALDFLNPVININGEHYTFDSGAVGTSLYTRYTTKHKTEMETYSQTDLNFGGAGGMQTKKGYVITFYPVINNKKLTIQNVQAFTEKIGEEESKYYGNIGQDIIKQFDKMTLNFEQMYIKFD